jgi:hypothetical protein
MAKTNGTLASAIYIMLHLALGEPHRGHCGGTRDNSGCAEGALKGSWRIDDGWAGCVRKCFDCEQCRFIAFGNQGGDCSWYSFCKELTTTPADGLYGKIWHMTVHVRHRNATTLLKENHNAEHIIRRVESRLSSRLASIQYFSGTCGGNTAPMPAAEAEWQAACRSREFGTWVHAVADLASCTRLCASCSRCRWISFDPRGASCSWAEICDAHVGGDSKLLSVRVRGGSANITLALAGGASEVLYRLGHLGEGGTSTRFGNGRFVVKVALDPELGRREACVLRRLDGGGIVPRLVCAADDVLVMEHAGAALTVANIPHDYRLQMERILAFMASRGVAHNDLWKADPRQLTRTAVELLVDSGGRLRVVDFNVATVNGSYACVAGGRDKALLPHVMLWFTPAPDVGVLKVLDAIHMTNRTLEGYGFGARASPGICRAEQLDALLAENQTTKRRGRQARGVCKRGDERTPPRGRSTAAVGEFSLGPTSYDGRVERFLPTLVNPAPTLADVRACMEKCVDCPRCVYVSVSTSRRACLWSALEHCSFIDGRHSLQTVHHYERRKRLPPVALDDFVTVAVRGDDFSSSADPLSPSLPLPPPREHEDGVPQPSLIRGFFAYRRYSSQSTPGSDATKSRWTWRGNYQDSTTLLDLADKPGSGTTRAKERGRRHVNARLSLIQTHFGASLAGKGVLELGSNLGMNLLELRHLLSWGVGVDVNPLAINQANYLSNLLGMTRTIRFYSMDLNQEPLSVVSSFLPGGRANYVFMFSVNAYVTDFDALLDALQASVRPSALVVELNALGDDERAIERAHQKNLRSKYASVVEITNYTVCPDCHLNRARLFVCSDASPRRRARE